MQQKAAKHTQTDRQGRTTKGHNV